MVIYSMDRIDEVEAAVPSSWWGGEEAAVVVVVGWLVVDPMVCLTYYLCHNN